MHIKPTTMYIYIQTSYVYIHTNSVDMYIDFIYTCYMSEIHINVVQFSRSVMSDSL